MVDMADLSDAKRRVVDHLVSRDHATTTEIAEALGLTDAAIRQHLDMLVDAKLVEKIALRPTGRGRPPTAFRLRPTAHDHLPDRHDALSIELLDAVKTALGEDALTQVLAARAGYQEETYTALLPPSRSALEKRVATLASLRTNEGYVAESIPAKDGSFVLVEHHCPIADAARACGGLCDSELAVFQRVLGPAVTVERTQHVMAGDARCAYTIRSKRR
jgi:predicted ArsR family transcriptional regulator